MTQIQQTHLNITPEKPTVDLGIVTSTWLHKYSQRAIVAGSLTFLLLICWADWITGPDIHLSLFYSVPTLVTTWFVSRRAGYLMAFVSAAAWDSAELAHAALYPHDWAAAWNTLVRITCLVLAVRVLSSLRSLSSSLEAQVQARTHAIQSLAEQLSIAEDNERRRLAHDIHDGFSQALTLHKLKLSVLRSRLSESENAGQLDDEIAFVDGLIQRARTLTFDLHPAMLDHFGLVATLARYAQEYSAQTGVAITLSEEGASSGLSGVAARYLFRAIKELVNNSLRHGRAKQIVILVRWSPNELRLAVDDDGTGFEPDPTISPSPDRGIGLAGIQERTRSFGGRFLIESAVGKGTRAVIEFPLDARDRTT